MSHVRDEEQGTARYEEGAGAGAHAPGRSGPEATTEVELRSVGPVRAVYAPEPDGEPDPGEIVWTWVPYEENDGRGKDRPVLIVAREAADTVLAVQLSSRPPRPWEEEEWMPLGSGPWDREKRDSWVGLDRILRVRPNGMRREACALDRARFQAVTDGLRQVYGWR